MVFNGKILFLTFMVFLVYIRESQGTILVKKGQDISITVETFGNDARIVLETNDTLIKEERKTSIKPGYQYTIKGNQSILDIFDFGPDKEGIYEFTFMLPNGQVEKKQVEVLMAELACALKHPEELLTKSDCVGFPKDKIEAWCQVKLPALRKVEIKWKVFRGKQIKSEGVMKKITRNGALFDAFNPDVVIEKGDVFQCYTDQLKCDRKFMPKNVIFAMNKTKERLASEHIMTQKNKSSVTCKAHANPSMTCTYGWWHSEGKIQDLILGAKLIKRDIKLSGSYDCIATCYPKKNSSQTCTLLADRVHYTATKPLIDFDEWNLDELKKNWEIISEKPGSMNLNGWTVTIILLVTLSGLILCIVCLCRCCKSDYRNVMPTAPWFTGVKV